MEFVIPSEQSDILLSTASRICKLFNVQVLLQDKSKDCQWVKICSVQGKTTNLNTAKDFIIAVCCPDGITEDIPYSCRSVINIDDIAINYGVLAEVIDKENIIRLKGSLINVALAKSLLENEGSSCAADVSDGMETCKSFARKLGYSSDDIEVVAKALWPGPVDNNTFLEELVRRERSQRRHKRDIVPRGISTQRPMPVSDVDRSNQQQQRQIIEVPRYLDDHVQADGGCHSNLCPIIIDGSNVAMHHGKHKVFSCRGIALCVEWFHKRGHQDVFALVPRYRADRQRPSTPAYPGSVIIDQHLLLEMADKGVVTFTPSKHVKEGKDIVCYDDRFIIDLAYRLDGVVVSNDSYRDLVHENTSWKRIIEKRVLMFSFVRDLFMVPDDPLGRTGPNLDNFLRRGTNIPHAKICPWIGHCTFGPKCRFYHPEKQRKAEHSNQGDDVKLKVSNGSEHMLQRKQLQLQKQQSQRQQYNQQEDQQQHHNQLYQQQQQQQQQQQHNQLYQTQQQHNQRYQPQPQQQQHNQLYQHTEQQHNPLYQHNQLIQNEPSLYPVHQSWPAYEDTTQHTIYCTMPTHYSYTPPNSFGYNNSASMNDIDRTSYNTLIEMFPDDEERIIALLKDNPQVQDIQILANRLL